MQVRLPRVPLCGSALGSWLVVSWREGRAHGGWIPVSFIGNTELFWRSLSGGTRASGKVLHSANTFAFFFSSCASPWGFVNLEAPQWWLLVWLSISICIKEFPNKFSLEESLRFRIL